MKKILIVCCLIIVAFETQAQDRYFFIALDAQKPFSNTSWIEDLTARGIKIGFRKFITPRFSAGIEIGSIAFDQYHPTETIENTSGAITTDYFKYIYSYSATLSGQYYFPVGEGERFFPYAGLGLGANNNEYVMYYNIYEDREMKWGFLARPEAGILYKFGGRRSIGVMASIHYNYSTNSSDKFGYNNFNTLGFQAGVIFMER